MYSIILANCGIANGGNLTSFPINLTHMKYDIDSYSLMQIAVLYSSSHC